MFFSVKTTLSLWRSAFTQIESLGGRWMHQCPPKNKRVGGGNGQEWCWSTTWCDWLVIITRTTWTRVCFGNQTLRTRNTIDINLVLMQQLAEKVLVHRETLARGRSGGGQKAKKGGYFPGVACGSDSAPFLPRSPRRTAQQGRGGWATLHCARTVEGQRGPSSAPCLHREHFSWTFFHWSDPQRRFTQDVGTLRQRPPRRDFIRFWRYVGCNMKWLYCRLHR